MSASPSPQFNANDEEKLGACLAIMPLVFDTLRGHRRISF